MVTAAPMMLLGHITPDLFLIGMSVLLWTMLIGLAMELLVLRFALGMFWGRALFADLVMNAASALLGTLVPLTALTLLPGSISVKPFGLPVFATVVLFGNTLVEWWIVRFGFRVPRERHPLAWLCLGNLTSVAACVCALLLSGSFTPPRAEVYQLNHAPNMLSESLAMEKARDTMAKAGFDLVQWHLRKGDRTGTAPDGTRDEYLERFGQEKWGRLHFTDGSNNRCVQIRLEGDRLICEVVQLP